MVNTPRSVQLLRTAIAEVDNFDALAELRRTVWELYAGQEEDFQDLMRRLEDRTAQLTAQLEQREIFEDGETYDGIDREGAR